MVTHRLGGGRRSDWPLLVVLSAVYVGAVWLSAPRPLASAEPPTHLPEPTQSLEWKGVTSCAAVACHNRGEATGAKGSEYTTWVSVDPHRKAYLALREPRSQQIEANLRPGGKLSAWQDSLCLSCHDPASAAPTGDPNAVALRAREEGVGCEGCHGPAQRWLTEHYLPGWQSLTDEQKTERGMNPTKNLVARARACAVCHVGQGDREVNHDLIAAGHPRLNFEYSAFLAIVPKHWNEQAEKQRYPDLEARVWAIGQAASAQAALELLASRAADKGTVEGTNRPWPEFAEYNCFACHHDLQGISWRQARDATQAGTPAEARRLAGSLQWNTWYTALLPRALSLADGHGQPEVTGQLNQLRTEMEKSRPDRRQVASLARSAAGALEAHVQALARGRYDDPALLGRLAREDRNLAGQSWDGAAQLYLALAAAYHAQGDLTPGQRDPRLRGDLETLRNQLEFPQQGAIRYDSPSEQGYLDRQQAFLKALNDLSQRLGR